MKRALSTVATDVLVGLHQHRVLDYEQLRALYMPAGERSPKDRQRAMERLIWCKRNGTTTGLAGGDEPLVARIGTPERASRNLCFLTPAGVAAVEAAPRLEQRPKLITPQIAGGPLQRHTQGVNDVGIAFVRAARDRGDECGPLAWMHEVAHPIGSPAKGRGRNGDVVISDAVLHYAMNIPDGGSRLQTRFIEFDRATTDRVMLVQKLRRYANLWAYVPDGTPTPAWRASYPYGFPEVLLVFGHADKPRHKLETRMNGILDFVAAARLHELAPGLAISCVLLEDLQQHGPFAPVFVRHDNPGMYVNWLGEHDDTVHDGSSAARHVDCPVGQAAVVDHGLDRGGDRNVDVALGEDRDGAAYLGAGLQRGAGFHRTLRGATPPSRREQ